MLAMRRENDQFYAANTAGSSSAINGNALAAAAAAATASATLAPLPPQPPPPDGLGMGANNDTILHQSVNPPANGSLAGHHHSSGLHHHHHHHHPHQHPGKPQAKIYKY